MGSVPEEWSEFKPVKKLDFPAVIQSDNEFQKFFPTLFLNRLNQGRYGGRVRRPHEGAGSARG